MAAAEEVAVRADRQQALRMVGRYAIYDALSAGGMGQVHFARLMGANGFSRVVAVKRLHAQFASDPEFAAMFLDEARLASRIRHPNVVATLDVASEDGELFLVMDYVRGEVVSKLLRATSATSVRPPLGHAVAIVVGALHGLHAAHEARNAAGELLGIVHRDVSPANVLVGDDGVARIIDFGVAKAAERIHFTRGEEIRGKVAYMAPEQLERADVDRRADVYAAAVVLWEMLAGRRMMPPEVAGHPAQAYQAKITPPPPPSAHGADVPRTLDDVVMKGLACDPRDRFATALEMAAALESAVVPSSAREVARWVTEVAAETLRRRDETLKRIEADPDVLGLPAPLPSTAPTAGTLTTTKATPPRSGRRALAASLVVLVAAIAWTGGALYGRRQVAAPAPTPGAEVPLPSISAVAASVPETASSSSASASAVAVDTQPAASSSSAGQSAPRPRRRKQASCNPPYRIVNGIEVAKVECL